VLLLHAPTTSARTAMAAVARIARMCSSCANGGVTPPNVGGDR
jgi:hypothetical protein